MKQLFILFMATVFSINCMAAYWPQSEVIPIEINTNDPNGATFTLNAPPGTLYQEGQIYYFFDGKNWIQGVCIGNKNGQSQWAHMKKIPGVDPESETLSKGLPNSTGGYFDGGIHNRAMNSAISTGIAHAVYRGFIYNEAYVAELNRLNSEIDNNTRAIENNFGKIRDGLAESQILSAAAIASWETSLKELFSKDLSSISSIQYESADEGFVLNLKELETVLRTARSGVAKRVESRALGLNLIRQADSASARGDALEANALKQYAEVFADIAIGLDPVTGPLRDTYEAFTGKNLITGEKLNAWDRGFAIVGAVTFGFGSKIARGIKAFQGVSKVVDADHAIARAIDIDTHLTSKVENAASPKNRVLYEQYLRELRETMEKPNIIDPKLKKFVDWYWRDSATVGNGSTAAALRFERITGKPVGDVFHDQKASNSVTKMQGWLKENPQAHASDKDAVENMLKDLISAIGGQ